MAGGYIRLHRKLTEWEWYKAENMVHLFTHLLLTANYKDSKYLGYDIKRGQVVTGRKILSKNTGISEQSIRTCIERLKSTNEITIKSTNLFSIVTICNYEEYQNDNSETNQEINQLSNQQLTSNQPATNQQLTTSNKEKEVKNIKNNTKATFENQIDYPWNTDSFLKTWARWKVYKKEQHSFKYRSRDSEQTALNKLQQNFVTEERAAAAIEYSISQGYGGIFEERKQFKQISAPTISHPSFRLAEDL